jgi:hypothetical protein
MLTGLGELYRLQGRVAEAEPLLRDAVSQVERALPADHWRRGEVESSLGACLWQLGRRDEGRPLLTAGLERLLRTRGQQHPATRRAQSRLDEADEDLAATARPRMR